MSILPFPSFLDDVKEKGFKKAVFEGIDDSVERLTAGLNVQDLREAFRGETPSRRPNPRLTPHADGFWLHMRPSYFNRDVTGMYPSFRLGWLSTYFVFFETITGILLMLWYTPSPEIAYGDMLTILSNVPLGQLMRDMHRLGAEFMVAVVALHMMRTWITGSYKKPRQFTWFSGLLLLVITGFLSFSGYLLPWDQLALWAVTIGASMAEATPVVGDQVNLLLRGAPELGANGLLRFYLLHVLALPALLFVMTGVHYYKVIIHGHSLPPQKENIGEDSAKRVPLDKRVYFIPDVLTNEMMWLGAVTFIITVLCIWFYHAPLENHADPQVTPLGTTAPWYFLWIQGALKLGDKFFWGVAFPTIALGALALLPYLDVTPSRRFAHRRVMLTLAMLLVSVTTILSYMGLAKFAVQTSAETEIVHELTFEPAHSKVGIGRTIPFDQMIVGAYTTAQLHGREGMSAADIIAEINAETQANGQFAQMLDELKNQHVSANQLPLRFRAIPADEAPKLMQVMQEFEHHLAQEPVELPNVWGALVITDNQAGLKRLDWVVSWDTVQIEGGEVMTDDDGEPVMVYATEEAPMLDEAGEPMLDDDGAPMMQEVTMMDDAGNPIPKRRIYSGHLFIHQESAYFD
ncbi:MAG: cytochrome bc complex cytochrome b subunit [Chloroflexi bacterium]|nr:cytochrome bc complex cytochrome b subunit [Chloroflexota bacterium]MCY3581207.1 cytochrome bc complex cytochrome b subunit [Chloroflexota bacterium]MCY3716805.1 cytochrome bc complex cytochrome b subunit [Chloroflexota bacterium]MDE2649172.1 cytochrome bc complex cytochrome b subunit [Chloroflexota bacterium]MYA92458.1 cytochrome bc complex cytochrome b subunit [Chloroflexota bacterium]